jgi:hypothetical protein
MKLFNILILPCLGSLIHANVNADDFSLMVTEARSQHLRRSHYDFDRKLATVFSQCAAQEGLYPDVADLGCIDFLTELIEAGETATNLTVTDAGGSTAATGVVNDVFEPIQSILTLAADVAGIGGGLCLGDFDGTDILDPPDDIPMVEICSELPLKEDAEWSLLAFSLSVPSVGVPAICGGLVSDGITIEACLAISVCDDLPSVAFAINGDAIGCLIALAGPATAGIGTVLGKAVELGLGLVGFGFSLTNAFEVNIWLYNGFDLLDYTATPTFVE